jgi:hypothetical protein
MSDQRLLEIDYSAVVGNAPEDGAVPMFNPITGLWQPAIPWVAFAINPTPVAPLTFAVGSPTVSVARYRKIGKTVFFTSYFSFTVGNAGTRIQFSLPVQAVSATGEYWVFPCKTWNAVATSLAFSANANATTGDIFILGGATWGAGAANCNCVLTGTYESV